MFAAGSLSARDVSDSDRKKYLQVFEACDEGKKGCLSREDLKVAVVMLFGYKPSKIEVDTMVSGLLKAGGVRPDEFVKLMALKRSAQRSFGDQRQIFSVFDTHCRGFLNLDDFKCAFKRVAPHLSEQTIIETFREVDRDADGLICYKDFEYVMNYGEDED
ncbi:EF-hand calcium-binding domain-containing protein 11 [Bufo gargarizans]|uniref:EF-hand calcium-binding domain-containing protein 11 n=1 Tax=Bufo gargarizans TaxID=30331 RepID=UPI001CF23619|nr:EF-hand calcium-binding domain-containing protein 11 [Bufo gargarizans]